MSRGAIRNVHFDLQVVMFPEESLATDTVRKAYRIPCHGLKNLNHHHVPIMRKHHVPKKRFPVFQPLFPYSSSRRFSHPLNDVHMFPSGRR